MARRFNGQTDVFYTPVMSTFATVSRLAWSCWAYPLDVAGEQVVFCNGHDDGGGSGSGFSLEIEGGNWKMLTNNVSRDDIGVAAQVGRWTHLCGFGSSDAFVNGSKFGVGINPGMATPAGMTSIGAQYTGTGTSFHRLFNGYVAEFGYFELPAGTTTIDDVAPFLAAGGRVRKLMHLTPVADVPLHREAKDWLANGGTWLSVGARPPFARQHPVMHPSRERSARRLFVDVSAAGFVPFPHPRGLAGGAHVLTGGMQ